MKMVPLFKCRDMQKALAFYTGVLDFELKYPGIAHTDWVIDLVNGDAELQLTTLEGDYLFGSVVNVWVDEVDNLFQKYLDRGLVRQPHEKSPVHHGPVDQSWGTREFYVTDGDGNTLRFVKPIE